MSFIGGRSICGIYRAHQQDRNRLYMILCSVAVLVTGTLSAFCSENFPKPYDSDTNNPPMSADQAAKSFKMPPGFKVTVFASEPDVRQPIAMTFDARGRLWVAENY